MKAFILSLVGFLALNPAAYSEVLDFQSSPPLSGNLANNGSPGVMIALAVVTMLMICLVPIYLAFFSSRVARRGRRVNPLRDSQTMGSETIDRLREQDQVHDESSPRAA